METKDVEHEEFEAWLEEWERQQRGGMVSAENAMVLWKGGLTSLPDRALGMNNLLVLDLRYNRLRELPEDLSCLSLLVHLDLTDNQITALPPTISVLIDLRGLFLSRNHLEVLPPELGSLVSLQTLKLDRNRLVQVPYELGYLPVIRQLFLEHNKITTLPPEIALLTLLETLRLEGNPLITPTATRVADVAPCAVAMAPLNTYVQDESEADSAFRTGKNSLSREAHDSLLEFLGAQLIKQAITHSELTLIPDSVLRTTTLQSLDLSHNELEGPLPDPLSVLGSLRLLNVSHNLVTHVPCSLTSMVSLQELNVAHNKIENTSSPDRMEEDMSFPLDLGESLICLETFLASRNALKWIPLGLLHCPLRILDVSYNRITGLPEMLPHHLITKGLRVLQLGNNKIRQIDTGTMRMLPVLEELVVEGNLLEELPYMGFLHATMRLLWAGQNRLMSVSPSLGKLTELRSLRLDRNNLQVLPVEVGMCQKIEDLLVLNNPRLYKPAPEIATRGPKAIVSYLQRLLQSKSAHSAEEYQHLTAEELDDELGDIQIPTEEELKAQEESKVPPPKVEPPSKVEKFARNLKEDVEGNPICQPTQAPSPNHAKAVRYLNQPCALLRVYVDFDIVFCDLEHLDTGKKIMRVKHDMLQ